MALHGGRTPRRLGLDVAATAAGVIAAQGVLAALVARARGAEVAEVETSVLDGALALAGHRIAVATASGESGDDGTEGVGPPFPTADGHWVELEAVSFAAWAGLLRALGAGEEDIDAGFGAFARRYVTGHCVLPPELHAATRSVPLAALERAAAEHGVAAGRLRSYPELIAADWDYDAAPWTIRSGRIAAPDPRPARDPQPLGGFTVVELTSRLQGPLAGNLLGMLGADVVKVEPPGGDPGRMAPAGPFRAAYAALNRGKRFVEIDYKTAAGRLELHELASAAAVFLHNSRAGRAERLGVDFASLSRINPGVVHAHLAGWDPDGPRAADIAGDYIVQADSACGWALNEAAGQPFPSPVTLLDVTAGLLACEAILAGLLRRVRGGGGSGVTTTLEGAAHVLQRDVVHALASGREDGRKLGSPLWGPLDRPIATSDGYVVVTAPRGPARATLAEVCGANHVANDAQLARCIARQPAAEWEKRLGDAGVPVARVRSDLAGLPGAPRVRDLLERLDGSGWAPAPPWRFAA
jgi:crotonobetainyl-CoA:carnitine CoA-transferase CaiB-like acyl-CoA transferase